MSSEREQWYDNDYNLIQVNNSKQLSTKDCAGNHVIADVIIYDTSINYDLFLNMDECTYNFDETLDKYPALHIDATIDELMSPLSDKLGLSSVVTTTKKALKKFAGVYEKIYNENIKNIRKKTVITFGL